MRNIIAIVEGRGELDAVPLLLRRIAAEVSPLAHVNVLAPIRVDRNKVTGPNELEGAVRVAARRSGPDGRILILLDADKDCPAQLGPELLRRARAARGDRHIRVVMPKSEFESWFLASAERLRGRCGLNASAAAPNDPEGIRDAKGWLTARMPASDPYKPGRYQAALVSAMDFKAARRAPSFDKLWRDVCELLLEPPQYPC